MIKQCVCTHKEQDKIHGKNMRVMNPTMKSKDAARQEHRCTVCNRIKGE